VLVYLPTLGHQFVWDDTDFIAANPAAHRLADLPRSLAHGYGWVPGGAVEPDALMYYRPVVTLANTLTWVVSGGRPWLFHLENVLAHGGAAALLALLAASLGLSPGGALLAGALFALHPALSEPVAWISGRTDVFAGFFSVLALLLLVRWRRGLRGAAPWIAALAIFFALGSKESAFALVIPAALILAGPHENGNRPRFAWISVVAPVLLFVVIRFAVLGTERLRAPLSQSGAPRLLLSGNLFLAYLRGLVIPWPLVTEPPASLLGGKAPVLPGVIGLSLLATVGTIWLWMVRRCLTPVDPARPGPVGSASSESVFTRFPAVALGVSLFLFGLLPVLQWVRTGEVYGERFLYLPMAGCLLVAAALGDSLFRRRPASAWVIMAILGVSWTVLLERRLPDWRNNTTLYASAARIRPESARALANYGSALAANGHPEEAGPWLERAVRLAPHDPWRHEQYGTLLLNTGRFAEASTELERAYRGGLRSNTLVKSLGVVWTRTERFDDAAVLLRAAMEADPSDPELPDALGMAERKLGRCDEAAAHFRRSIQLAPSRPGPWMNLIAMLACESGDRTEAVIVGNEFLRKFPAAREAELVRRMIGSRAGGSSSNGGR
jgi:Tfp pilus assembly protein PilF